METREQEIDHQVESSMLKALIVLTLPNVGRHYLLGSLAHDGTDCILQIGVTLIGVLYLGWRLLYWADAPDQLPKDDDAFHQPGLLKTFGAYAGLRVNQVSADTITIAGVVLARPMRMGRSCTLQIGDGTDAVHVFGHSLDIGEDVFQELLALAPGTSMKFTGHPMKTKSGRFQLRLPARSDI